MAWINWVLGSIFYFYQFVFRTIFATLGDEVSSGFSISMAELSGFFAAGMLAYALMQIPGGMILDKLGPRQTLIGAMGTLSAGIILVGLSESYALAIFGRVLMGVGSAFGFLGTSKIVISWFPIHMMSLLLGTTVFMGSIGGAFSNKIYNLLPQDWSWRVSLTNMGVVGVIVTVLYILFLRDKPLSDSEAKAHLEARDLGFFAGLKRVLENRQIMLAAFFTFFAYLPISLIADSWGPLAFEKMFNASKEVANTTIVYFYVSFALGNLFFSSLASYFRSPKAMLVTGSALMFVFVTILLTQPQIGMSNYFGIPGFLVLTSLIAFSIGAVTLSFTIGCSHASKEVSGTVVGVINMLCMVSGSIFSKITGYVLDYQWDGTLTADGIRIYAAAHYEIALLPLIFTSAIALVLVGFMRRATAEDDGSDAAGLKMQ